MRAVAARRTHRYEDPATGQVYVIPGGEVREVPEHVAAIMVRTHPDKLYYMEQVKIGPDDGETGDTPDNSNLELSPRPSRRKRARRRDGTRYEALPGGASTPH